MTKERISADALKTILRYEPESGDFYWISRLSNRAPPGSIAGIAGERGYKAIHIRGRKYFAHRLAWFYVYGVWPDRIDHIDGNPSNNRIDNLRICTQSQNNANACLRSDNSSGHKGVTWHNNRWQARIKCDGRSIYLGRFEDKSAAQSAYQSAAYALFGEFARTV